MKSREQGFFQVSNIFVYGLAKTKTGTSKILEILTTLKKDRSSGPISVCTLDVNLFPQTKKCLAAVWQSLPQ